MNADPLWTWATEQRDAGMALVASNAGPTFSDRAKAFVRDYLADRESASGEEITDAAKLVGIQAHDDRAMGPVFLSLSRQRVIEKCGSVERMKGHRCTGGNLWRLSK